MLPQSGARPLPPIPHLRLTPPAVAIMVNRKWGPAQGRGRIHHKVGSVTSFWLLVSLIMRSSIDPFITSLTTRTSRVWPESKQSQMALRRTLGAFFATHHAVDAPNSLCFEGRVKKRFHEKNMVCLGQIDPHGARSHRQ